MAAGGGEKLEGLQALRALAALAVVVFHAGRYVAEALPPGAWRWGEFGVDVFFVVSGFVMMVAVPRDAGWREFARRRAIRILPMYWLATLLMAALLLAAPSLFTTAVITLPHFVLSLLLLPHYSPATGDIAPLLVPGWTLSYELYFYLVFALCLRGSDAVRVLGTSAALLAMFVLGKVLPETVGGRFLEQPLVFEFVFGLAAGAAWRRGWRCPPRAAWAVLVVAAAWLILASTPEWRVPTAGIAGLAMVWALASIEIRGTMGRALVVLGDASYSLYLLHPFVVGAAWLAWQRAGVAGTVGAVGFIVSGLVSSAFFGWLAWRAVEAPVTRALRHAGTARASLR